MEKLLSILAKVLTSFLKSNKDVITIEKKKKTEVEFEVESNIDKENRLSIYFTLEEVIKSETATRKGITNIPSEEQIMQIQQLCSVILDPIREHYGKAIRVTSGYRGPKLNKAIGGSSRSQHQALNEDAAIDFQFYDKSINLESVFNWITQLSNLPFDQCIAEFLPEGWIHISYKIGNKNRGKITRAVKAKGRTVYEQKGQAEWMA